MEINRVSNSIGFGNAAIVQSKNTDAKIALNAASFWPQPKKSVEFISIDDKDKFTRDLVIDGDELKELKKLEDKRLYSKSVEFVEKLAGVAEKKGKNFVVNSTEKIDKIFNSGTVDDIIKIATKTKSISKKFRH